MATKLALIALALSGMIVLSMQFPYDPMSREERKYQERRNQILTDFFDSLFPRGSCISVGGTGCEGNNARCCRKGDPYTGTMRKCVNTGSFSSPVYTCKEA